jgi:transposase InsO family protein
MKRECLVVAANRKRQYGPYLREISHAPDNLINRNSPADTPNEKWLADITEFHISGSESVAIASHRLLRRFGGSMSRKGFSPDKASLAD